MTQATPSASASSAPTKSYEKFIGEVGTPTSSDTVCQVYSFESYAEPQQSMPAKHMSISQLVAEWEQDDQGRIDLEEGRRWVADTFYDEDGDTVRTMRLRMGWSQNRLADELNTSQSHVARIERGTENLTIETCRKLSRALGVDMNTLDQALRRQEFAARAKQK